MDDSLSFSTPPDSPLSPFSPVDAVEDEIEDSDSIRPPFLRKVPPSVSKSKMIQISEEDIEMEIEDGPPPTPPLPQQFQSSTSRRSISRGSNNSKEGRRIPSGSTMTNRPTTSQRRIHRFSPSQEEDGALSSSLSSSFDSQNSWREEERREKTRERRERGWDRDRDRQRQQQRQQHERQQQERVQERERDILPSSPSSGDESFQQSQRPKRRPSQDEEEIDDFSDSDPLMTMLNNTFSTPSTSTPTPAQTPTTISPNTSNTSFRGEELLPDEDIGSFSPPPQQNDFFLSSCNHQPSHHPKTPSSLPSGRFSSPAPPSTPLGKGRIINPPQLQQSQRQEQRQEEDIEMDPVSFPSSLRSPHQPLSHLRQQEREEILDEFRSPNSLSPFPPSRSSSSTFQRSAGRDKRKKVDHGAEVEQDVRDDEDDEGLSSVDDLDCDLDDIGRGGGGGGGVGVGVGCGTPLNNAPGGSGGGSLSACGAREMTFIIAGENEEEDSDDDDDVIDASFDFGPSGQDSFLEPVEDGSGEEREEEEEEAIESMSEGEEILWEKRGEGIEKRGEDPPPSNSLDEESGLGTISLDYTKMKGSPYTTPKNTQKWGKGKNSSHLNRKRHRVSENSLENLMGVAVTRHTQLLRELAHTEGEEGGRRRGAGLGLKMNKMGIVVKRVMGEEKCGDGRGGEAGCMVVEARPYISKKEGTRKMILFIKKKGGIFPLSPGHLCVVTSWYECSKKDSSCQFLFCENFRVTGAIISQREEEKQNGRDKEEEKKKKKFSMRVNCQREKPLSWLKKVDKKKVNVSNSFLDSQLFSTVRVSCTVCCTYPHPCLREDRRELQSESCFSHFSQFQSMILVRDRFGFFGLIALSLSESYLWWRILFNSKGKKLTLPPLRIQGRTNIAKNNEMHSILQLYQAKTQQYHEHQQQQQRYYLGHTHSIPLTLLVPSELTKKEEEEEEEEEEREGEEEGVVEELVLGSLREILGGVKGKKGGGGEGFWRVSLRGVVDNFLGTSDVDFVHSGYLNIFDDEGSKRTIGVRKTRSFHLLSQLTPGTPIIIRHAAISRQWEEGGAGEEAFSAPVFIDEFSVIEKRNDMC